jgi:hypothetical protein
MPKAVARPKKPASYFHLLETRQQRDVLLGRRPGYDRLFPSHLRLGMQRHRLIEAPELHMMVDSLRPLQRFGRNKR